MEQTVRVISNITKVYPDMIKIIVYKEPKTFVSSSHFKRDKSLVSDYYQPKISSLNRTKTLVHDLVLCNDFELFCTFTFNPKKIDSFSYPKCRRAITMWLHHQSDRSRACHKKFSYLIIPEMHKSGRWHFHALISGYVGSLRDSGHKTSSDRIVYNITSFRSGFTTAVPIDNREGVSNYITKYITKDFIKQFNQRRFMSSRDLKRPEKELNSTLFRRVLPLFKQRFIESSETFSYYIDKNSVVCDDGVSHKVVQYRVDDLCDTFYKFNN